MYCEDKIKLSVKYSTGTSRVSDVKHQKKIYNEYFSPKNSQFITNQLRIPYKSIVSTCGQDGYRAQVTQQPINTLQMFNGTCQKSHKGLYWRIFITFIWHYLQNK